MASTPEATHRRLPGTLVFTDLTGFTAMSERLAALGKVGSEELTERLDATFTELLTVAGRFGGSLLKFGGDALLLFFWGDGHEVRAARAGIEMQAALDRIGLVRTTAGEIRLRMTVGAHSGDVDFFLVGSSHRELIVSGPAATETVKVEGSAQPGEVRVSGALAALLDEALLSGGGASGAVLARPPEATEVPVVIPHWPEGWGPEAFVPAILRDQLASGVELTEHRQMAVGFVHLANLDHLLEDLGAETAARHLETLVGCAQESFARHGVAFVSTDIYEGGPKIICATGAVRTHENDDERLLRSLREILDLGSPIDVRIGVNRGHGFCGYVGPDFRRTFVTIGDVVNTAARVMAKARPGDLLSTRGALERSETAFETEELPPFEAKGKSEPLVAYRVGRVTGERESIERRRLPLVGRDDELAALFPRVADLDAGRGGVVEIVGEAGIGKSRLAEELLSRTAGVGAVEQRCGRYAASTAYFPFRALLADLVGGSDTEALVRSVKRFAPHLEPYVSLLATAMGMEMIRPPEIEQLGADERKAKLHESVEELISAAVSQRTIWLVEDVHWIDSASANLLRHLGPRIANAPLLICLTRRPAGSEPIAPDAAIELGALTDDDARELVRAASTKHLLPKEIDKLIGRAHGNPHFLIALAEAVSQHRDLDQLPDTLEALLAARVDELPPADRLVLRKLAVLGNRFDAGIAREVIDGLPALGEERTSPVADFVDFSQTEWRFIHTLVRDTAYEGLAYRDRREVHARAGYTIESRTEDPNELCELLSLHFHNAAEHAKSLAYSNAAAQKAERSFASLECATFWERSAEAAKGLDDPLELSASLTGLAWAKFTLGDYASAAKNFEDSLYLKRALGNDQGIAGSLTGLGLVARSRGEYDSAKTYFQEALEALRRLDKPINIGAALNNIGIIAWLQGRYEEAKDYFEQALESRRADGDRSGEASSLDMLGSVAFSHNELDIALKYFEESLAIRRELDDKPGLGVVLGNLSELTSQLGRMTLARRYAQEGLVAYRDVGDRQGIATSLINLARVDALEGEAADAKAVYEESLAISREIGDPRLISTALHGLADVALADHDPIEARRLSEEAVQLRRGMGEARALAEALTTLGLATADELAVAQAALSEALRLHREVGDNVSLADCLDATARLCAFLGEARLAATLIGAVEAHLSERAWPPAVRERRAAVAADVLNQLGDRAYELARSTGKAMTLERAVELAAGFFEDPQRATSTA